MSATESVFCAVWFWIKTHWKPLLLGISTLGVGLLVGRLLRKPPEVVAPALVEADEVRENAQLEENREVARAKKELDDEVQRVIEEHAGSVDRLTDAQRSKVDELKADPEALNDYLLQVGRDIRN